MKIDMILEIGVTVHISTTSTTSTTIYSPITTIIHEYSYGNSQIFNQLVKEVNLEENIIKMDV